MVSDLSSIMPWCQNRASAFSTEVWIARLTMTETTVIMELDLPSILLVHCLRRSVHDLITDNLDVVSFWPDQMDKQASDYGRHAGAEDNDRHFVLSRPLVECLESWIELNVLAEELNAFWEWGWDAVDHLLERVSTLDQGKSKAMFGCLTYRKFILSSRTSIFNCLR